MEDNMILLYLLIIIKNADDIYVLIEKCNISSITLHHVYVKARESGFITERENESILTEKGKQEIILLRRKMNLKGIEAFVFPFNSYKREIINRDYIYVPRKFKNKK